MKMSVSSIYYVNATREAYEGVVKASWQKEAKQGTISGQVPQKRASA